MFTAEQRLEVLKLVRYIMEHKGGSLQGWATLRVSKLDVAPPDLDEYSESPSSGQL